MGGLFLHRPALRLAHEHLHAAAGRHRVTDIEIIKVRKDTKIIARGSHPEWGDVAVKAIDPVANSIHAHAAAMTDRLVVDRPASFLPTVHASGPGYVITEWIQGSGVRYVSPAVAGQLPFEEFVDALATWCRGSTATGVMEAPAVLSALRFYVETTIRRMRYRTASRCIAACVTLRRDRGALATSIDEMAGMASRLELPATLMFSDVHMDNLVTRATDDRIVMVDYEALRPGSYLFDVVFCLASMMIARFPKEAAERLAAHVFSSAFMPSGLASAFFRRFAGYVVTTYMTIDGVPRSEIEANQAIIYSAAR
jgi:hypothetical protein